jgi:NAD-dependent SIR2 family protein deacetylase
VTRVVSDPAAPMRTRLTEAGSFRKLHALIERGGVLVLSGAGISTESGIPDYRGPTGLARRAQPMTYQEFTRSPAGRQRYWARSHLGWRHIAGAEPNAGHRAVAELDRRGLLSGIITQNVDGLHQAAGARHVTELHGNLGSVVCLRCGQRTPRTELDARLRAANPGWDAELRQAGASRSARPEPANPPGEAAARPLNPDGDAEVEADAVSLFRVVDCESCGGLLKPDVVFFGENVPPPRVARCHELVGRSAALLVLGSSLTVMSGYRFVRQAAKLGLPVAIVNQGPTRGDCHAVVTIDARLGQALTDLVALLPGT